MAEKLDMRQFEGAEIDGRYRLEQYLAEGSFGAVYRAAQLAYGVPLREVAFKISKRPMDDAEARRTFGDALLMAKVVGSASDPAIRQHFVTIYDAGRCLDEGTLNGHPYLVMEYIHGGSLHDFLKSGPFPLTRAMQYFDQLLEAMAFMHGGMAHPVAHRDLKPDNILVSRGLGGPDRVVVTDFGLAVEVDTLLGWVDSGGDLAYLAPESFSHDISSPQSDVYMLGLVFYEMLTGSNPFSQVGAHLRGEDEDRRAELRRIHLLARQMERFPVLDTHLELRGYRALLRVLRTTLAADMDSRSYRNACDLRAAWQAAINEAGGAGSSEPAWETARRLAAEAEACFAVADTARGDRLLQEAMALNRDRARMPDARLAGKAYLLAVQRLLQQGQREEAKALAHEGFNRRKCHSTYQALIAYYQSSGSPLAGRFMQEMASCRDQE
jgi:hypothetical protein